jgi:hypothetical protein
MRLNKLTYGTKTINTERNLVKIGQNSGRGTPIMRLGKGVAK